MSAPRFEDIEGEDVDTVPDFDAIEGDDEGDAPPMLDPASISREPYGPEFRPELAERSTMDTARGAVAALLQGPTFQWADEMAGLQAEQRAAVGNIGKPLTEQENPEDAYREGRDAFRAAEAAFREENPKTALALTVAGGLAGGTPLGASQSFAARALGAAGAGAAAGAGGAEEKSGMAFGAALGAPLGVAGQAVGEVGGELFGRFLGALGRRAGGRVAAADAKAEAMRAANEATERLSAQGKLGSEVQKGNRMVENMMRLTGRVDTEEQAVLNLLEESGAAQNLRNRLAQSVGKELPGQEAAIDAAEAELKAVLGRTDAEREVARQAILSGGEAKRQLMERVKRYAPTLLGAIMGADKKGALGGALAGYALGGTPGSALIGGLAVGGLRPAAHAVSRMVAHPAVQRGMYAPLQSMANATGEAVEGALAPLLGSTARAALGQQQPSTGDFVEGLATNNPQALGQYAEVLQRAAAEGSLSLVHWSLQQKDPQYRAMLEALRKEQPQ